MLGRQYKYMGRFYVAAGETFRGIVPEPVFLETTEEGRPLSCRADRLDGWYLGVPTGRRFRLTPARASRRAAPAPGGVPTGPGCPLAWPLAALLLVSLGALFQMPRE